MENEDYEDSYNMREMEQYRLKDGDEFFLPFIGQEHLNGFGVEGDWMVYDNGYIFRKYDDLDKETRKRFSCRRKAITKHFENVDKYLEQVGKKIRKLKINKKK